MAKEKIIKLLEAITLTILFTGAGFAVGFSVKPTDTGQTIQLEAKLELPETVTTVVETDQGEVVVENYPYVEEVDGGQFIDSATGLSLIEEGKYNDLGWSETYPTDTWEAFRNATLGRCIIANNIYGAQCVSLARVYWWSYADRDVSTCGTGMAKGMMNCSTENAGDDFLILGKNDPIQAGDWLVFDSGVYGHIGMALSDVSNGYVTLLGENQGGASCGAGVGGAATNIINLSMRSYIGGYRPKAYIIPEPEPEPEPIPLTGCLEWYVQRGDTMGKIMMECEGTLHYGEIMDNYAKSWYSRLIKPGQSVYEGWHSSTGVGLYADDIIDHKM